MSGTGKTSLAYAFGEFLDNKTVVVPIQPMWKERTDLVGYYNEFTHFIRYRERTVVVICRAHKPHICRQSQFPVVVKRHWRTHSENFWIIKLW